MSKEGTAVGLDGVLEELGPFGRYNIVNYALLLFPCFLAGLYGQAFVFEAADIDYRCNVTECEGTNNTVWLQYAIPKDNETASYSSCTRYGFNENITIRDTCGADMFNVSDVQECTSYVHAEGSTAVIDFNLFCQDYKRTLIGTIRNSGLFLSLPLTGIISDRYGRRLALSVTSLMNCICGLLRSFSTSYEMMVAFAFLEGALGAGAYSTAFVLAMELVGPKGRVFGNTLINVVFVFGMMSLAGLAWALQSWRTLLQVMYGPACLVFSYIWILNESARWLLSKGRHDEAVAVLKRAAKMNNVQLSEDILSPLHELDRLKPKDATDEKDDLIDGTVETKTPIYLQVIRSSIIRKRLATSSFLWITCTFVYYGLSINSVTLAGNNNDSNNNDKYINFMLVAFIEIPANFCCLFVLGRYGRKRVLIVTYFLSAVLCIGLSFIPKDKTTLSLVIYLSGKFAITVAYSSVYIYVSEVFPTNVRQSLLAICSATGRVGSVLAPLTPMLAKWSDCKNLPVIFFGSLAVAAGLLVFTLPETLNVPLPNSIEEAERLSKEKDVKNVA